MALLDEDRLAKARHKRSSLRGQVSAVLVHHRQREVNVAQGIRVAAPERTGHPGCRNELMTPDVVLIADGGGLVPAAPAPIYGAELVAKLLARAIRVLAAFETTPVWLNGAPAGRVEIGGQLAAVRLVVENGRVTRIYAVATRGS